MAEVETDSRKRASNPNRGSKPGEKRGGRKAGTPNKANRTLREAAREYTDQALAVLTEIMADNQQPAPARVSAANAVLDRGYGKPAQPVDGDGEGGAIQLAHKIALIGVTPDAN